MKALIIEDETAAATNLKSLLREIDPSVEIVDVIDTVVDSIGWIRANPLPDIVFMDIHLADGQAFKIFEQIFFDKVLAYPMPIRANMINKRSVATVVAVCSFFSGFTVDN